MRRHRHQPREAFALKVAYPLGELARMGGLSRKELRTLLRHEGVPIRCPGPRHRSYVLLSDLQQLPRLWGALLTKLGLEAAFRAAKMAPDEDF